MSKHNAPTSERLQQLERLSRVADTARWVSRSIRQWFPVEGGTWVFEGIADNPGVIPEVLNALIYLDDALYPPEPQSDRYVKGETPLPRASHFAAGWLIATPVIWQSVHLAVLAIMHSHEQILHWYSVHGFVASGKDRRGNVPLQWPEIPPIAPAMLDALDKAAAILSEQIGALKAAAQRMNSGKGGNGKKARGGGKRNRKSQAAQWLLFALDDRTNLNKNQTELADLLNVAPSTIWRAFNNPKYAPQLRRRYEEWGLKPPTIRDI
jgi:hypothetical protein